MLNAFAFKSIVFCTEIRVFKQQQQQKTDMNWKETRNANKKMERVRTELLNPHSKYQKWNKSLEMQYCAVGVAQCKFISMAWNVFFLSILIWFYLVIKGLSDRFNNSLPLILFTSCSHFHLHHPAFDVNSYLHVA